MATSHADKSQPTQADNTDIIIGAVVGGLGLAIILAVVLVATLKYCCYRKKKDHERKVLEPVSGVVNNRNINDERLQKYFDFLTNLLRPKRIQEDSGEFDEETRQQLSAFLTEIIQKNKMIGREIIKIVEKVDENCRLPEKPVQALSQHQTGTIPPLLDNPEGEEGGGREGGMSVREGGMRV